MHQNVAVAYQKLNFITKNYSFNFPCNIRCIFRWFGETCLLLWSRWNFAGHQFAAIRIDRTSINVWLMETRRGQIDNRTVSFKVFCLWNSFESATKLQTIAASRFGSKTAESVCRCRIRLMMFRMEFDLAARHCALSTLFGWLVWPHRDCVHPSCTKSAIFDQWLWWLIKCNLALNPNFLEPHWEESAWNCWLLWASHGLPMCYHGRLVARIIIGLWPIRLMHCRAFSFSSLLDVNRR